MSISLDEVKRVAALARLAITEEDAARYAIELSAILEFAASIRDLDTAGVPQTTHVLDLVDVWRDDVVGGMLDRETVLTQAPASEDGCFLAPRIV